MIGETIIKRDFEELLVVNKSDGLKYFLFMNPALPVVKKVVKIEC